MLNYFTEKDEPRWTRWLLLVFVPVLALYFVAAKGNGETKNHDVYENDQKVYLNTAKRIAADPFGYSTPRQRTPGYPYFLALFYSGEKFDVPEGTKPPFDLAWFERGKSINLYLSIGLLVGLFVFSRRFLPLVESGIVATAVGLLLFTFKAGYVQPELSYWVLNTILFVLFGRMLVAPSWTLAVVAGVLTALTYFVKAGTQPLLLLFAVTWVMKVVWDWWWYRRRGEPGGRPKLGVLAGQGALVVALYFVLLVPYFSGTTKTFGKPFYSVYTEYMLWLPLDDEGGEYRVDRDHMWGFYHSGARERPITLDDFNAGLERAVQERLERRGKAEGWSGEKLAEKVAAEFQPVKELANPGAYFARYDAGHGVERVKNGFRMINKRVKKYYERAADMLAFTAQLVAVGLLLRALLALFGGEDRRVWRLRFEGGSGDVVLKEILGRHPYLVFYAIGFFVGYGVLYAWYDALGIGPRLMLSLYLPLLFVAVWALAHIFRPLALADATGTRMLYLGKIANVLLLAMLVYLSCKLMTGELYEHLNTGG